jgi:hypothetical protein
MFLNVAFIGSLGLLCPYGNTSSTDSITGLGTGGSNLNMTVTWWNADGYTTTPLTTAYPGSSIGSESITWQNDTGSVACPFETVSTSTFPFEFSGGIDVHLANIYQPTDDVSYEAGAVLLSNPGEQSIMLDPPDFSYQVTKSGLVASLTLFNLVGNLTTESGTSTASIATKILSNTTSTFGAGVNGVFLGTPYYLNVTTMFPAAWMDYFSSEGAPFPNGATCVVPNPPLPSGYSCTSPPPGVPVIVVASLYAQSVTVTSVEVGVHIY